MKKIQTSILIAAFAISSLSLCSCKGGGKDKQPTDTVAIGTQNVPDEPVEISSDQELGPKVKDATKDFPGVTGEVSNGEITITGSVSRDRLPTLMQSLNALGAKKINNKLTIND